MLFGKSGLQNVCFSLLFSDTFIVTIKGLALLQTFPLTGPLKKQLRRDKNDGYHRFRSHESRVTCAAFAPEALSDNEGFVKEVSYFTLKAFSHNFFNNGSCSKITLFYFWDNPKVSY